MAVIEAIATTYLEADAASVEFTSIPATYEHLQLRFTARGTDTTASTYYTSLNLQFGTGGGAVDTGTNYARHYMLQAGQVGGGNTGINQIWLGTIENAGSGTATEHVGRYAGQQAEILDYANANKTTTVVGLDGRHAYWSPEVRLNSGLWTATGAVDRIKLAPYTGSFVRGSEFTLYGLNSS
jgi:hypothetical protein